MCESHDGAMIRREEASDWLKQHFASDPNPQIHLRWEPEAEQDDGAYHRLLALLFTPRSDSLSA